MIRSIEGWEEPIGTSEDGLTVLMRPKRSRWEKCKIGWRWRYRRAPFLARFMRLGFVLRTNNNARAVFFLLTTAIWFFANVAMLVASFVFAPNGLTDAQEQSYNYMLHGIRATDLEMSGWLHQFFTWCWSLIEVVHPWSWFAWSLFALFSIVYLPVALREEFAEAIDSAREMVSRRTTTDLPDQPSGQPSVHTPARVGGGMLGNFLKNRLRFGIEDYSWDIIQGVIERGWRALQRGG